MEFWARRPLHINLIGAVLLAAVWLVLGAGGSWLANRFTLPLWWPPNLPAYAALLIATLLVTRFFDRLPAAWAGIGLHRWWGRELLLGILLGGFMGLTAWAPVAAGGEVHRSGLNDLGYFLLPMCVNAAGEELLFRGYLFQRGVEVLGPVAATLLASVLFGVMHVANPNATGLAIAIIIIGGIFFSLCYLRTGSLWLPIGAHIAWNVLLAKILGVPVSGREFGDSLLRTVPGGADLITGGAFGPEGGLAGVVALVAGIALLLLPWFEYSPYVHADVFRTFHARRREPGNRKKWG